MADERPRPSPGQPTLLTPTPVTPTPLAPTLRTPTLRTPDQLLGYVRADVRALGGYTTGAQGPGFTKLNTNECAYPPSPRVQQALADIGDEALRLYPDPVSRHLRDVAAGLYGVAPEQIIVGNGSDDCLTILFRTFLSPGDSIACPWPSYGLYDTLAGIQGAPIIHVDYRRTATRWDLPDRLESTGARTVVVANPNNPSSTLTPAADLRRLADALDGVLIVDEAYVDFALPDEPDASMLPHLAAHPNVIVLRTFSKSYSLAGARLGLLFAAAPLVAQMNKVKDSYNVNVVSQALGAAALEDRAHHAGVIAQTLQERARLERELATLGWTWPRAHGNFLLCEVGPRAPEILAALHARKILVRHWDTPALRTCLRVTVGNPEQNDALFAALRAIV
ncbi:MAG: histidinol-phosphate transaminase [Bacteroidota bacterium]